MSHAKGIRLSLDAPRSRHYQGPFGRLFGHLEPWRPSAAELTAFGGLEKFAKDEMVEERGASPSDIANNPELREELDHKFNSSIPAGYTYFGQFVDHDVTFDATPLGARVQDPQGLHNFRTPRLDLDNVYGRGPDDQPYLYQNDSPGNAKRFLVGQIEATELKDLPRNADGRALIGDMRNDENAIVSQLQLAFLLAHNTLVEEAKRHPEPFKEARRQLTWLYQRTVWNDFLERVLDEEIWQRALSVNKKSAPNPGQVSSLGLEHVYNWKHQPFMPLEFAAAAYRFGHSMVRNEYQTNEFGKHHAIFDNAKTGKNAADLRGERAMSKERSIQWDWFLQMESSGGPFPQRARKLDTKLSNALASLPFFGDGDIPENVLAFRNLKRGIDLGLPSGPDVARALGYEPVDLTDKEPKALWYYILKEAEVKGGGQKLGKVGSTLVGAVFAGLLMGDKRSYLNVDPHWHPSHEAALNKVNKDKEDWGLPTIIRLSGLPVSQNDFNKLVPKPKAKTKPKEGEGKGSVGAGD